MYCAFFMHILGGWVKKKKKTADGSNEVAEE